MKRVLIASATLGIIGLAAATLGEASTVRCAWVDSATGAIVRYDKFKTQCPPDRLHKNIKWLPAPTASAPPHDPATQVREGPKVTIGAGKVTEAYTVRPKTPQEIDADKDAVAKEMNKATFRALCHLKNEIRTRVEGLAAWSAAQCLAAFKGLL